jgi:hypothetical protein
MGEHMSGKRKYLLYFLLIGVIFNLTLIALTQIGDQKLSSDDLFVQEQLRYLDDGASDIDFIEVNLYFGNDDAYLEIIYDYSYLGIERRTRLLANRYTGQIVGGGYEDYFPDFVNDFNIIKLNYSQKLVYTQEHIDKLLDK